MRAGRLCSPFEPIPSRADGTRRDSWPISTRSSPRRPGAKSPIRSRGFPTSSIDWCDVIDDLAERYRVSALDFPGYGFSDKPRDWPYSLTLDAELLAHHVQQTFGGGCRVMAHDRGDSVALVAHQRAAQALPGAELSIEHLVLSNGNIFLRLASLTPFQKLILDPTRAPEVLDVLTPETFAAGLAMATFTPPRSGDDPAIAALAATFAANDGLTVLARTVQYLRERAEHETAWLETLASARLPAIFVWGLCDTVAPPRVAMHVWEAYLREKPGSNELWVVPEANHYLQNDRPDAVVAVLGQAFEHTGPSAPGATSAAPGAPIRVDHSSSELTDAADGFTL